MALPNTESGNCDDSSVVLPQFQLDDSQRAAVQSDAQFLQIIGYPGAGKTSVTAHYIARLIYSGVDPSQIVALTHTKSARHTLRQAVVSTLAEYSSDLNFALNTVVDLVKINNFHGLSQEIITAHGQFVDFPTDLHMYDALDSRNLASNPLAGLSSRARTVNLCKYTELERSRFRSFLKLFKAYDFDLALQLAAEIIRSGNGTPISHVLIDEFQDCTNLQWELVKAIHQQNPRVRIIACGDPNQEIFGFQPDHFGNAFENMKKEFPNTQEHELLYNYRSTPQISATVQSMLTNSNMNVHPASQTIQCVSPPGPEPELLLCPTKEHESQAVLNKIREYRHQNRFRYRDIAILVRTNAAVHKYMALLNENDIPGQSIVSFPGMGLKKLPGIAITLMKWANEPRDLYLMQLLYNPLCRFIRRPTFAKLETVWKNEPDLSLRDALVRVNPKLYHHPFVCQWLPELQTRLLAARSVAEIAEVLQASMNYWEQQSGLKSHLTYQDAEDWQDFVNHLCSLFNSTKDLSPPENLGNVDDCVPGSVLASVLDRLYNPDLSPPPTDDKVSVLTIHSAKSREWPAVLLPSPDSVFWQPDTPLSALRLQYVGASRAQKELTLFSSDTAYQRPPLSFLPVSRWPAPLSLFIAEKEVRKYPRAFALPHYVRAIRSLSRHVR